MTKILPDYVMGVQEKLVQLLSDNGYPVHESSRSIITTCPQCSKEKHLYIFKGEKNNAKCMRCGTAFSPQALVVALTGCTYQDAKKVLTSGELIQANETLSTPLGRIGEQRKETPLQTFVLPANFYPIEVEESKDGLKYLLDRGVHLNVLKRFDIRYCPSMERVVFPVYAGEACVGFQGRDITGQSELRYLSPQGFTKARVLLGQNLVNDKDYVVLVEGPIDALRVATFLPVLCSMGKNVSQTQIELIKKMNIKKLYLGLDPDAYAETDKLAQQLSPEIEIWIMQPPPHKKDFGESSDGEILLSFKNARRYSKTGWLPESILK